MLDHMTLNKEYIHGNIEEYKNVELRDDGVLADLAPTLLDMMKIAQPKEMTGKSLIEK